MSPVSAGCDASVLDAVIPVDLARRPLELLARLDRLFTRAPSLGLRCVVGHDDRGTLADRALRRLATARGAVLVSARRSSDGVNNAALRNRALREVRSTHVLFLDADLFFD